MRFLKYYEKLENENWFIFTTDTHMVFEKENKRIELSMHELGILKRHRVDFYEFFKAYEINNKVNVLRYAIREKRERKQKQKFVEINEKVGELASLEYLKTLKSFKGDKLLDSFIDLNIKYVDLEQEQFYKEYEKVKEQFFTKHNIYEWFDLDFERQSLKYEDIKDYLI